MIINFYDTSALLSENFIIDSNTYISTYVISELEKIKNDNYKSEEIKNRARKISHELFEKNNLITELIDNKKIKRILKRKSYLPNNNDGYIIAEAIYLIKKGYDLIFFTADYNMYLFAKKEKINVKFFNDKNEKIKIWKGWENYSPSSYDFNLLYSNTNLNTLNAKTNEYCKILVNDEVKDVLRWDGEKYCKLKYKNLKNPFLQETIYPRNLEQKMAFDMLQNPDIKVKMLYSRWGSGKTLLAITYALEQIYKGNYQKIVFIRNNIIAKDTNDIGFLPGDQRDKTKIWAMPLASHVGGELMLDKFLDDGIIEVFPLSHIRGLSIKDSIIIADECENLTTKHITLLLSRVEENSEIIFCGDMAQVDFKQGAKYSGMNHMINTLAGDPLFGVVKLIKSERGPVPNLCDKISPPSTEGE